MGENNSNNSQLEFEKKLQVPHLYHPSLELVSELGRLDLWPADDERNHRITDPYKCRDAIKTQSEKESDGRWHLLDQYLTRQLLLRNHLHGTGPIVTEDDQIPEKLTRIDSSNKSTGLQSSTYYDDLISQVRKFVRLPEDSDSEVSRLEIIINRAYEAYAFRRGITADKYPTLEYPVGFGTMPRFFSVSPSSEELGARVFMHRAMQNPIAIKQLVQGYASIETSTDGSVEQNKLNDSISIPAHELNEETLIWAQHLRDDWKMVEGTKMVNRGKDYSTGLPDMIDVKGWAQLDLDYNFVHLARKKLSVLMMALARAFAKVTDEANVLDGLNENESVDFLMGNLNDHFNDGQPNNISNWWADDFIPEHMLVSNIFYEVYGQNKEILQSEANPLPGDIKGLDDWIKDCESDPEVLKMRSDGKVYSIMGIVTDVRSDDITDPDKYSSLRDPLLMDGTHDEVVTPEQNYSIYVHPKIWREVRKYLESTLNL